MSLATADLGDVDLDHDAILKSLNLNPRDPKTQALLLTCERYGLDPILKHAMLIKGNLYVTRDGLLSVAHRSGQLDGIVLEDQGTDETHHWAVVSVYRKDMSHPFRYRGRYPIKGSNREYAPEMAVKTAEVMALRRAFNVSLGAREERWDEDAATHSVEAQPPPERRPPPLPHEIEAIEVADKSAQQPLDVPPATPESAADATGDGTADGLVGGGGGDGLADEGVAPSPSPSSPATDEQWQARNRHQWALIGQAWPDADDEHLDANRRRVIAWLTAGRQSGPVESSKALTDDEWPAYFETLEGIGSGRDELHQSANGGHWVVRRTVGGGGQSAAGTGNGPSAGADAPTPAVAHGDWSSALAAMTGPQKAGALKRARRVAGDLGVDPPASIDEVAGDVAAAVLAELAAS